MNVFKRFFSVLILNTLLLITAAPSWAVVILYSTFKKSGFEQAEALALSPQFQSLILLNPGTHAKLESYGSGAWIGNYEGHGYVLTAAHMFPANTKSGTKVKEYTYETLDGEQYHADAVFIHPLWNENFEDRTGYDLAIVRLQEEITDAGPQPALYGGTAEKGKILTFIGYGARGTGNKGENTSQDTDDEPAAAVGLIEVVTDAVEPVPATGDAGSEMGIWLPKEDGSIPNPLIKNGITKPVSPLTGILGSGDSGGPAWIETENGWAIAGVNSNGTANAAYGEESWFIRVSHLQEWITQIVPTARFIE